jgi:hypothetical protein
VIVSEGKINGGDQGFMYRGSYELTAPGKLVGTLNVKRWNPSHTPVFGNLSNFDLKLIGQITPDGVLIIDGAVAQQPALKIKIEARWIESVI